MENVSFVGFRLSPLQKLAWSTPGFAAGRVACRVLIEGELDVERLKSCFDRVAEQHESLRTVFQLSPGFTLPFQVVREKPEIGWGTADGPVVSIKLVELARDRHILALRVMSLCCDTESIGHLIAGVAALYQGETAGEDPVQYADFAEWHNELLLAETEESQAAKDFWSAAQGPQALPFQSRLPLSGTASQGVHEFVIDGDKLDSTFLLGCWQSLLARLTGQDAVTVDVISIGRPLSELHNAIGLFARPLAVRASFDDPPSFSQLFGQVQEAVSAAEHWQSYCPADAGRTIGFEFQQLPGKIAAGGASFTITDCEPQGWPFQLALLCRAGADQVRCELRYDAAKIAAPDAARIARYFERTVEAAAADPSAGVFAFDLLDDAEYRQVVEEFNQDRADYGDPQPFHQLFEAQATLTPDRLALVFESTVLTYSELNGRANRIAGWLRKSGVSPSQTVGICLERSAEMIVALLGILKAGGAYVPLLPDMPGARLAHQIGETGLRVIVTMQSLLGKLPEFSGRTLCLDRDGAELESESADNLPHSVTPNDLIYVLYTSGSTGVPKGVAVRHENVSNYLHGILQRLGLQKLSTDPGLTFATVSTLGADLGNTSIFPPLVSGGCLAVISYDSALDGRLFAQRHREHPIDVLKITPANLNALLATGKPEDVLPRKFLLTGGEACTWELAQRVQAAGVCTMLNHYGPTETTVGCLTYRTQPGHDPAESLAASVPLGRPLPNLQVYLLDRGQRPAPVGAPAEICIGGAGTSNGYLGRPDETREKFMPHPFLPEGGRLYRSGDLGRFLPDGSVEFLGRLDGQIKIRGHRVELAEIESVMSRYPGVRQAVALLASDNAGPYISAYVSGGPEAGLQEHLRSHLPEYMMPRELVVVESFPLNANGKVDRRKLAEIKSDATPAQAEVIAPRNELETRLLEIWKESLAVERIGIRDDFFELGGHSLLATKIISRIRTSLAANVTIRMLFEAPTVELLAQAIGTIRGVEEEDSEVADLLAELEGLSDSEAKDLLADG